ncbi:hypothetical protein QBC40DRAFT_175104 [Triangularia verruculosa]|uniref:SH3 domain-containing protein n=1 Tax=Triangularia verruculosa TaxID=2587418 RepID=A0AAN7AUT3_9PEZI|nr:hypothetical protein QBC40DRAFT_175104 [Triangularia verruculosa]
MTADAEDLLIRPFRDVVAVATTAAANAASLGPHRADDADRMSRAAQALAREAERAIKKLQPVWDDQVQKLGDLFKRMITQQASIEKRRLILEELLWDFDDVTNPDEFDIERYSALQAATKALALDIVETTKRLKPIMDTAPQMPEGGFPPLPPLPIHRFDTRAGQTSRPTSTASARPRALSKQDPRGTVARKQGGELTPPDSPNCTTPTAQFQDFGIDASSKRTSLTPDSFPSPSTIRTAPSLLSKSSSLTSSSALLATPEPGFQHDEASSNKMSFQEAAMALLPPPALEPEVEDDFHEYQAGGKRRQGSILNEHRKSSRANPRSEDCSIGPDSTYHKLKGLCKGAVRFRKDGHWGSIKMTTEYGGGGGGAGDMMRASDAIMPLQYEVTKVAGCGECGYAHDLDAVELDKSRKPEAIIVSESGARYRLRLLFKSHLGKGASGGSADDYYACLWCVSAAVTVRESDATVFRSADDLLQHLSRHPQPLPQIPGVTVCHGSEPEQVEFDLHLPDGSVPVPMPDNVTRLATAAATKDHFRRHGRGKLEKPPRYDGEMLEFMEGARIVGVMFPEKWEGKWCLGRHDGMFGAFPAKVIELRAPQESEVPVGGESGMIVTTRWKWTPPKSGGVAWVAFGKGEVITNVQCLYADYWCWYGTNSKGKTGVFPQSHVDLQTLKAQEKAAPRRPSRGLSLFGR